MIPILLFVLIPLAFFGAGVLFASLLWGKYKQLAITLRQSNDALARREAELSEAQTQTKSELLDVQTTCRTLEEELANLAVERDQLVRSVHSLQAEIAGQSAAQEQVQTMNEALDDARAAQEILAKEVETLQVALRAAENTAATAQQEKDQVLNLVNKLQAGVSQVDDLKRQLRDREQQLQKLAKKQPARGRNFRRRRAQQPASTAPRPRRPRRSRPIASPSSTTASHSTSTASVKPETSVADVIPTFPQAPESASIASEINGHEQRKKGGVTKRMFGRLLGNAKRKEASKASASRRHW